MMNARVSLIMAALALAGTASLLPVALAEEDGEAALKHQLEEVREQLHELQLKVRRIEAELGAVQAPSPAAVAPTPVAPSTGSPPPRVTAAPPGIVAAPTPSPLAPSAGSEPPPPPVRVEAGTSPPAAVPAAFMWREAVKERWSEVKAGMSSEDIRKLLGTPSREFTLDGKPVWYYSYAGIGNGSVMFNRDGHTVAAWQHPPFGLW
jgi:hypothetical protein